MLPLINKDYKATSTNSTINKNAIYSNNNNNSIITRFNTENELLKLFLLQDKRLEMLTEVKCPDE